VECVKPVKMKFFVNLKNNLLTATNFYSTLSLMKMKIEIDINDLVDLKIALGNAGRRIDELMNDKPDWRKLYDLDKNSVEKAKKIVANMIANS
jgi:hypothetical protein